MSEMYWMIVSWPASRLPSHPVGSPTPALSVNGLSFVPVPTLPLSLSWGLTYIPAHTSASSPESASTKSNKGKIAGSVIAALAVLLALLLTTLYIIHQRSKNWSTHWRNRSVCLHAASSKCDVRPTQSAQLSLSFAGSHRYLSRAPFVFLLRSSFCCPVRCASSPVAVPVVPVPVRVVVLPRSSFFSPRLSPPCPAFSSATCVCVLEL
ncbi:hypothetical protein B0H13DRAFT_2371560 [Mycena leptocephala]|nr:hypothetical protein B0H13DRAFT_2371560 [Mycena leptocephala]